MPIEHLLHRNWHSMTPDAVMEALDSTRRGLSESEAARRRAEFGANILPSPPRSGMIRVFLRQFKSPLIYLLLAATVMSLAIGELTDAIFIFVVLQVNAAVGTVQEWKAETSAEALGMMIKNRVAVIRDGLRVQADSAELTPGDMVLLESGTRVPADIRLFSAQEVHVDESLLTGESLPVEKNPDARLDAETPTGDRATLLHAGSMVISGRGEGMVVLTGLHTEIGRIAQALTATGSAPPPLVLRLEKFTRNLGLVIIAAVAMLAVAQFLRGMDLAQIFFVAVALAVSAIPEGLPVAITVALSVGAARMARRRVIVRRLPAVEGLGACTLIASDKTGTLTLNKLTVKRLLVPGVGRLQVEGEGYEPQGGIMPVDGSLNEEGQGGIKSLALAAALCNEATFRRSEGGDHRFGDTVDIAFLVFAAKAGVVREDVLERYPEIGFIPFDSSRRYAASFNRDGDTLTAFVKGAAEDVLPMCRGIDLNAGLAEAEAMAVDGYRVLAVAMGAVSGTARDRLQGLKFLGLVGLIDPLRPEAPAAVRACRRAGIEVRMITGDHPATAMAIARDLNIAEAGDVAVTGAELKALSDDPAESEALIGRGKVFARVEPVQKLAIVQALQRSGHFVSVTGDGANDAPALRAAHIGVAMGRGGTDVARGASDLILTDDNFATIVNGVEEGRIAYDNVRKVVYLLVTTAAAEIILFALSLAFGLPIPLFAAQLLWLNLVTQGIQDVALAFEKGEPDVLKRKPRPPRQPIFDRRMIEQTFLSGAFIGVVEFLFFYWALDRGIPEFQARYILLLLMVMFENIHIFNCRSEIRSVAKVPLGSNWFLISAVLGSQLVHLGAAFVPGLKDALRIEPISLDIWLMAAPLALSVILVMEIYKFLRIKEETMI